MTTYGTLPAAFLLNIRGYRHKELITAQLPILSAVRKTGIPRNGSYGFLFFR